MDTKLLNYRDGLSYPTLLYNIEVKEKELLDQISRQVFDFKLANKYCLNTCYTALFIFPLAPGYSYSFNDVCLNVKGILSQNLYSTLCALSDLGMQKNIQDSLRTILSDCMSYETLLLLRVKPVVVYGILLYYYVLLYDLPKLLKCSNLVTEACLSKQPTLAWESLYLFFEEEVIKNDTCN